MLFSSSSKEVFHEFANTFKGNGFIAHVFTRISPYLMIIALYPVIAHVLGLSSIFASLASCGLVLLVLLGLSAFTALPYLRM